MTKCDAVFEMTLKVGYGRLLKFYINSDTTIDELRQLKNELAQDCRKVCDAPVQATKDKRLAQVCSSLASKCRETGAAPVVVLNGQVSAADTGKPKKSPAEDLEEAQSALADKAAELADLDSKLAPYWPALDGLKTTIARTHSLDDRGVIVLDLVRREDRKQMFQRLDEFNQSWAPVVNERRIVKSQVKDLERQVARIAESIAKERKRANAKSRS